MDSKQDDVTMRIANYGPASSGMVPVHPDTLKEIVNYGKAARETLAALIYLLQETDPDLDAEYNPHAMPRARAFEAVTSARAAGIKA